MHWLRAKENHEAERGTDHMIHSRSALHSAGGTCASLTPVHGHAEEHMQRDNAEGRTH